MDQTKEGQGAPRFLKSIGTLLRKLDRGQLWSDMEQASAEIVDGLKLNGGVGKLTIEVNFRMKNGQFMLDSKLAKVVPQAPRVPSIMFEDSAGELTDADPRQPRFEGTEKLDDYRGGGIRTAAE